MGITAWRRDDTTDPIRVLVVDDERDLADLSARVLTRAGYLVSTATSVEAAQWLITEHEFAVVLTDMHMPGQSGLDLAAHVREHASTTAIVVVTGVDDPAVAERAIEIGAVGYLLKPFNPNSLLIEVSSALRHRHLEMENARYQAELERRVSERTAGLTRVVNELQSAESHLRTAYEEAVDLLCRAAEFRDADTGSHLHRMSLYSAALARAVGVDPVHAEQIRMASPMHDIGKIAVPDHVLLSTGALSDEERAIMQRHPETGYALLKDSDSPLLRLGGVIALSHHERFDGTGYPYGLRGQEIPMEGRIVAIADVFDALTSTRPYKRAFPVEQALEMVASSSGTHFDPDLVGSFIDITDEVTAIANGEHQVIDVTETATQRLAELDAALGRAEPTTPTE